MKYQVPTPRAEHQTGRRRPSAAPDAESRPHPISNAPIDSRVVSLDGLPDELELVTGRLRCRAVLPCDPSIQPLARDHPELVASAAASSRTGDSPV
jgi:hypothetical protein